MRTKNTEVTDNVDSSTQTPIEIALQIDENGMTSLRALYEFLQLSPSQYSRWCNRNVLNNPFAIEGIDYFVTRLNVELCKKGNFATDYKLTSDFAKQLSMTVKNERGQEARRYFLACEQGLKVAVAKSKSNNAEAINTLNNIASTLSSITDRLTNLEQAANKPKLPVPKYSRWKSLTFEKLTDLMNYVNRNSDQELTLANTLNLVFKETKPESTKFSASWRNAFYHTKHYKWRISN